MPSRIAAVVTTLTLASTLGAQTVTIGVLQQEGSDAVLSRAGDIGQGQSFVAPVGATALLSFSAYVAGAQQLSVEPGPAYLFELYAWDGTAPTGPAIVSNALPFGYGTMQLFSGYVPVVAGNSYLAVLRGGQWGPAFIHTDGSTDVCAGGRWVMLGPGMGARAGDSALDARFSATFESTAVTSTPEPASLALVATGLVGGVGVVRRRRTRGA